MQIQPQSQVSPSLYSHQMTDSSLNEVLKNAYIDKSNTSELLSEEYLRNYTYLEYSMFPELFPCYLAQLDQEEVKGLLDSYLGTFMEFFIEGTNFQMSYDGVLSSPKFVQMFKQGLRLDADQISNIAKQIHLQNGQQAISYSVYELTSISKFFDFLRNQQLLINLTDRISQYPIANSLFDLICQIIKFIISKDWQFILSQFTTFKYIIYAALRKITENKPWEQQFSQNNSLPKSAIVEDIAMFFQILFIPVEMELNQFMNFVRKGETKNSFLTEMMNKDSNNARYYIEFLEIIKNLNQAFDRLRKNKNTYPIMDAESASSPIEPLNSMIQKLEIWTRPAGQKPSQNCIIGFGFEDKVNKRYIDAMKELSYENVENIAKMLARVSVGNEELNEGERKDEKCDAAESKAFSNRWEESDMRQFLDVDFLAEYKLMGSLVSNVTQLSQIQSSQTMTVLKHIQSLFELTNTSLCNIYRLSESCITQTNQNAQSLSYECTMLIEAINALEDKIKGFSREKSLTQGKDLLGVREKIYKIKNSLLTNVLSLQILLSAFGIHEDIFDEEINMPRQYEQCQIQRISDISKLFATIMQFSAESSTFLPASNLSPPQAKQQITTLPYLQNILLFFGSIQLWHEFSLTETSSPTEQQNEISQFMQDTVKQYSQQNIKIDSEQVVYVERILTLMQVFENQDISMEIPQVNQTLGKLCEMKRNKGLNVIDVVNVEKSLEQLLELLAMKLLAGCFPKEQSSKESKSLSQTLYKIPFWKILTLSETKQQLSSNQLLQHVLNNMSFSKNSRSPIPKSLLQTVMSDYPQVSVRDIFQIFFELKGKYLRLVKYKQQLKLCISNKQLQSTETKKGGINSLFKEQKLNAFRFYLNVVEIVCNSFSRITLLSTRMEAFSGYNQSLSVLIFNQLNALAQDLKRSLENLAFSITTQVIQPKLCIFKPSPHQISQLLSKNALQPSEDNNEKLTEKISEMQKFYSHHVDFGVFALGFVSWAALETKAKIEFISSTYNAPKPIRPKVSGSSTYHLLQMVTSLSLCTGESFHLNFQSLQSYLHSGVDPIFKQPQSSLSSYRFSPLSLQSAAALIEHLGSYQFLEFVYEFIPFGIESESEQMDLYNLATNYAINEDNQQFLNPQKTQKIRINRISHFLEYITTQKSYN